MTAPSPTRRMPVAAHRALWVLQILLGLFSVLASALPKFWGDPFAVAIFDGIGLGQWLRYVVGFLELAGGIGLCTRRFAAPAATGLVLLMIGAALTQAFVLHGGALVVTPLVLGALAAVIAVARRNETLATPR
ncbi:DoxX family protein [Pseudonocardia alni]|uniref:DoxX family protein n=1 Tax=Pseudonocardia alni TaxID=33907 RepID=UPI00280A8783|nr:DoxX family protein [Pseudonocardia alni]